MYCQLESFRQGGANGGQVGIVERGYLGGAEGEGAGEAFGQGEDFREATLGFLGAGAAAGEFGVFGPWPFDVNVGFLDKPGGQQGLHHVGAQAVGVQLHGKAVLAQFAQQPGQVWDDGGLAAGDHQSVKPVAAFFDEGQDVGLVDGGVDLRPPGQVGVVAGGAAQVAPAEKEDRGVATLPVDEADGLQTP